MSLKIDDPSFTKYFRLTHQNATEPLGGSTLAITGASTLGALVTLADGVNVATNATNGSQIGTAVTQKIGFWGKTPIVQPAGASQAAVATTASTSTTPFGYSQAQADGIVTLLNALRTAMVNAGLIKGSA